MNISNITPELPFLIESSELGLSFSFMSNKAVYADFFVFAAISTLLDV